jgi:hypothetical protein
MDEGEVGINLKERERERVITNSSRGASLPVWSHYRSLPAVQEPVSWYRSGNKYSSSLKRWTNLKDWNATPRETP